jgi:hypothetical protein
MDFGMAGLPVRRTGAGPLSDDRTDTGSIDRVRIALRNLGTSGFPAFPGS